MKKTLVLLAISIIFISANLFSQIQVGTGSETNKGLPIEPSMSYTYSQVIYLAGDINDSDGGTITQLKWYFNGTSLSNSNNWTIYMGHTTKTSFTSTTDWIPVSSMTQVWSNTFPSPTGAGWITFDITDWNYNGTDNIVVAVDENSSGSDDHTNDFYCTAVSDYQSIVYEHIFNPDPASPPEATARRLMIANIIFDGLSASCPAPSNQTESDIKLKSVTLNWAENGTATQWQIQYGPEGFTLGNGTEIAVSSKPHTLTGLNPGTYYDWYVRSDYNAGGYSDWSNKHTFQTESLPGSIISSFPYTESFESDLGDWHQFVYDDLDFTRQSGTTPTTNTGPSSAYNGSWYLYTEATGNNPSKRTDIIAKFDFSTLTVPQFTFNYNMHGYYMGTLRLLATTDNGVSYTELWSLTGDRTADWHQQVLYLKNYGSTNNVILKIEGLTGGETSDMAIDNIDVREAPSCLPPEAQTESSYTTSSVVLNWTENGSATSWDIEYSNEGFTQGEGTTVNTGSKPYGLNGLSSTTHYDWYVRADCGSGSKSSWTGPRPFFTSSPAQATPYFENFDTETPPVLPEGVRTENNNNDFISWETNSLSPFSGTNSLRISANGMLDMNDWFFTPGIQLTGGTEYELGFMYLSGWDEELEIKYGTEASSAEMTNTINNSVTEASSGYEYRCESFTPSSTGTYYIGFHGTTSGDGDTIHIDDLYVTVLNSGTITWNGTTDENWWNSSNWIGGNPPSSYADVVIPPGKTFYPNVTQLAPVNTFVVQSDMTGTGSVIFSDNKYLQLAFDETAQFQQYIGQWTSALHGWHNISSPVESQNIQPSFVSNPPSTDEDLYKWDEANNQWVNCKTSQGGWNSNFETTFQTGRGYLIAYSANQTASFSGTPNYQDVAVSNLSYTSSLSSPGWHLLGNPYPSALYWNKTDWNLTHVDAVAKVWKESTASYTDISSGTGIIPAMQGFMVHVNSTGGSLTIDASDRTNQTTNWMKDTPANQIKLTVFDTEGETAQESVIKIIQQSTTGFDPRYDARFLPGYAPRFYSVAGGEKLSTNTLPYITASTEIPLGFVKNNSDNYYLKAENINNLEPDLKVYLTDNKTGKVQYLNQNPVYYFTAKKGDADIRFTLHFQPVGINETAVSNPVTVFDSRGNIIINTEQAVTAGLFVYNITGQLISISSMHQTNSAVVKMNGFKGIAIVKVVNAQQIYTVKVFIQ